MFGGVLFIILYNIYNIPVNHYTSIINLINTMKWIKYFVFLTFRGTKYYIKNLVRFWLQPRLTLKFELEQAYMLLYYDIPRLRFVENLGHISNL